MRTRAAHGALLLALACLLVASCAAQQLSARECAKRGFSKDELVCSTCNKLGDRLKAAGAGTEAAGASLVSDCGSCCQEEVEDAKKPMFNNARLSICS